MQEEQIVIVLYGDDIDKYQNKLTPFSTYLISTAKVRAPLPYGLSVNTFEWVIDRFTVVEQIKEDNTDDPPLPAPTRLNIISLANLEQQPRHVKFDVLTVVVSCGPVKFAGIHENKRRQIIIMDAKCRFQVQITDESGSTTATLLGELGENLLSVRDEQIYEIINIKKDPLPLQYIEEDLANKVFKIQLRKSYSRNSDAAPAKLFVSSFVEKQDALQLLTSSTSLDVGENSKRDLDNASPPDEPKKPTIGSTSSSKRQQLERTTP
ncbi:hypothetical protein P3S67_017800 [Capsicum chacoense]